jgi:hypothetical protein
MLSENPSPLSFTSCSLSLTLLRDQPFLDSKIILPWYYFENWPFENSILFENFKKGYNVAAVSKNFTDRIHVLSRSRSSVSSHILRFLNAIRSFHFVSLKSSDERRFVAGEYQKGIAKRHVCCLKFTIFGTHVLLRSCYKYSYTFFWTFRLEYHASRHCVENPPRECIMLLGAPETYQQRRWIIQKSTINRTHVLLRSAP